MYDTVLIQFHWILKQVKIKTFVLVIVAAVLLNGDDMERKAYFAAGCFWGVEYYFQKLEGVKRVTSGYMGGETKNPTYHQVLTKTTGHLEAVEVVYDASKVSFESLSKYFFEIHDFTQTDGQGPDIGPQYLSAIFYQNEEEEKIALGLIETLENMGYKVATQLLAYKPFYEAETYHQDYYLQKGTLPYCHTYRKVF